MRKLLALLLVLMTAIGITACTKGDADITQPTTDVITTAETTAPEIESDLLNWAECTEYSFDEDEQVKNIILLIGDGMGENIIKNAEIVKGEKLSMQNMPHSCFVSTDSLSGTTDSAAASTAISCGIKTTNKFLGMDENRVPVETICEFAKARGMKTGLVATQIISHATPAGMATHYDYRDMYNGITKDMINMEIEVLLGGGSEYTDTAKNQQRIKDHGYTYVKTSEELTAVPGDTEKLIGAFAYNEFSSKYNPSLTTMTTKALEILEGEEGFFLMVEASHIDMFESKLDMDSTITEMQAFDKCIDYTLRWAQEHPGTLVIVTADHETGGVTVPESGKAEDVNKDCFTSGGEHTSADVLLFSAGAQSGKLFSEDRIDNTDIAKIMRKALNDTYGEKPVTLLNQRQ
ncbi:MAG: alkaline phosphatase [Eubacteriales bacterium]|nr:alkaline phosphatase [Eubacteriales bacterium]